MKRLPKFMKNVMAIGAIGWLLLAFTPYQVLAYMMLGVWLFGLLGFYSYLFLHRP